MWLAVQQASQPVECTTLHALLDRFCCCRAVEVGKDFPKISSVANGMDESESSRLARGLLKCLVWISGTLEMLQTILSVSPSLLVRFTSSGCTRSRSPSRWLRALPPVQRAREKDRNRFASCSLAVKTLSADMAASCQVDRAVPTSTLSSPS